MSERKPNPRTGIYLRPEVRAKLDELVNRARVSLRVPTLSRSEVVAMLIEKASETGEPPFVPTDS